MCSSGMPREQPRGGWVALWEWCSDLSKEHTPEAVWCPYDPVQNAEIEAAFLEGKLMRTFEVGVRQYEVLFCDRRFNRMVQHDSKHHRTRTVRRRFVEADSADMSPSKTCRRPVDEEDSCIMCLKIFRETPTWPIATLPCKHEFHAACVQPLATQGRPCPLCKKEVEDWSSVPGLADVFGKCVNTRSCLNTKRPDPCVGNMQCIDQPSPQLPCQQAGAPTSSCQRRQDGEQRQHRQQQGGTRSFDPARLLLYHSQVGNRRLVEHGIAQGVPVDARSAEGATPLMMAATNGHLEVVTYLLGCRANVHLATQKNRTALLMAGFREHNDIVRLLLDHRANPDVAAIGGMTAWHIESVATELKRRGLQAGPALLHGSDDSAEMEKAASSSNDAQNGWK
mmetsp:Transcript_30014/g.99423  ORF Transcript_30014/g.99423 Transcript_30014/m.99423 type:complete len:394 (-) Transcript_30014:164-1345(-)